ncbi:MAG: hypothetical protein V4616_03245 [Bacteroidota bacterium]
MTALKYISFCLVFVAAVSGCKKESENPYEVYQVTAPPVKAPASDTIDPNSFVGLHNNIFRPTCANSGCHDGTFEPDFRTIESTYNTLVLRPINKNDQNGTYKYRVVPGNSDLSVLYQRLIKDIDGMSGTMPLSVDPTSDWNSKKQQYISNVKSWIDNGAKNQFGNPPAAVDLAPGFEGMMGFADSQTTPMTRLGTGQGGIRVPYGTTNITLYFSFKDDKTAPAAFTYNKLKTSPVQSDFGGGAEKDLSIVTPISGLGYTGSTVSYTHKITLKMSDYPVGLYQYVRVYIKDANPTTTEIPSNGSADYIQTYFSFVRQ